MDRRSSVWRGLALAGVFLLFAGGPGAKSTPAQEGQAVAIVAHPNVPVDNLSFPRLRRIFRAEQKFWPNRSKITLLMRAPGSYERDVVLARIYRMSEAELRKYWIGKMFRTEVATGPKTVPSTDMAHGLVASIPGAITFVAAGTVQPGEKVIRIDGKLPNDPGYPLR